MTYDYSKIMNNPWSAYDIKIDNIVSIYYFEFSSTYVYAGERHNFWEMVYVDTGDLDIIADNKGYRIKQGDLVFHRPNEFHALSSTGSSAPTVIVISFVCSSAAMKLFENRILNIPAEQRHLIADVIKEAKQAFVDELGVLYIEAKRRKAPVFGAEQLMYANLEKALISFYRLSSETVNDMRACGGSKNKIESEFTDSIVKYMSDNIASNLKLDDICAKFYMSKTQLKTLFKRNVGHSVISYYNHLKMEEAKKLLRQGNLKITQISKLLGYDSVHYFSASFKNHFNMNPTEYHLSVKAREDALKDKK